jgi:hypothetical protein
MQELGLKNKDLVGVIGVGSPKISAIGVALNDVSVLNLELTMCKSALKKGEPTNHPKRKSIISQTINLHPVFHLVVNAGITQKSNGTT